MGKGIIKDVYDEIKSTIEHKGKQIYPIKWRKGFKQECPLSLLLFNF
jgi:ribosomal protein S3AE